jgi:hypothetical protein
VKYPCYPRSIGLSVLAARRSGSGLGLPPAPVYRDALRGGVEGDTERVLGRLKIRVSRAEAQRIAEGGFKRDEVEVSLSVPLFDELEGLPAQALGDPDFWRFLALDVLWDFVTWRHGDDAGVANFGLDSVRRIPDCVPLRMFNRGLILSSASIEVSPVAQAGGVDFWQSHVLRVYNRFDPRIVRMMLEALADGRIPDVDVLRQVAKEIRQIRSNLILDEIDEHRLKSVLHKTLTRES